METSLERTLFVTDLDGTLFDGESRVSPSSAAMINSAVEDGARFTVATARTPGTLKSLLADLDLRLPLIVMTGAAIWDYASDRYLDVRYHREEDVRRLLDIYRAHGLSTFIYTMREGMIHIYHQGELNDAERKFIDDRRDNRYKVVHIDQEGISELPDRLDNVVILFAIQPLEKARAAYEEISRVGKINSVCYPDMFDARYAYIEAFPEDATKAKAIRRLAAMTGMERLVVFGDNVNDIPMVAIADEGIAVGNAVEELKRIADKTIGRNTEDAVAREIASRFNAGVTEDAGVAKS